MRCLPPLSAALSVCASLAVADGTYLVTDFDGQQMGALEFVEVAGIETVWDWYDDSGSVVLFIENPRGGQGDWSRGTYYGYYVAYLDHGVHPVCRHSLTNTYGEQSRTWGEVVMTWEGGNADFFYLDGVECGDQGGWSVQASFDYGTPQPPRTGGGTQYGGGGGTQYGGGGGVRGCTTHTLTAEGTGRTSYDDAFGLVQYLFDETLRNEGGVLQSSEGPFCMYTHQGNNNVSCEITAVICN